MSETEKPKRKVWQFHLSSAIFMLLLGGGLLLLNTQEHHDVNYGSKFIAQGWSFPATHENASPPYDLPVAVMNLVIALAIVLGIGGVCANASSWPGSAMRRRVFFSCLPLPLYYGQIAVDRDRHSDDQIQYVERGWPFTFYTSWAIRGEGAV